MFQSKAKYWNIAIYFNIIPRLQYFNTNAPDQHACTRVLILLAPNTLMRRYWHLRRRRLRPCIDCITKHNTEILQYISMRTKYWNTKCLQDFAADWNREWFQHSALLYDPSTAIVAGLGISVNHLLRKLLAWTLRLKAAVESSTTRVLKKEVSK